MTPRSRTFEFVVVPRAYGGPNIPIFINQGTPGAEDTANDVALKIANAVNSSALNNSRQLFIDGVTSGNPLQRVSATLLGDVNEVTVRDPQPGLRVLRPEDSGVARRNVRPERIRAVVRPVLSWWKMPPRSILG